LKSFNFWIFNDFFYFYIGDHFENFKNKKHNFEWWSIFVSSFKRIRCSGMNLTFLHLGYHGNGCHFEFVQPLKSCHTLRWIFLQSFMKEIRIFFKSPLFCFHGNCGKVCPTDSFFFGLSRSTRCGCCSFHLSSISVLRVTCYDHFCVFHFFFSILAISMATAAILEKSTLKATASHDIWYSYKVS
jgi:hypothetical protein